MFASVVAAGGGGGSAGEGELPVTGPSRLLWKWSLTWRRGASADGRWKVP